MLYTSAVDSGTLELLKKLMTLKAFENSRLVGGTALALQLGHRKSIDLDLFGSIDFEQFDIKNQFAFLHSVVPIRRTTNILVYILDDIKVDLVNYSYSWIDPALVENEIRLASLKDIAAMKLNAITGRGTKKDFVDLSFLLEHFNLQEMLNFFKAKYFDGTEFLVLKSLLYFDDAEKDKMPEMIIKRSWESVKSTIKAAAKGLT
jgi:hypothetical protein